MTRPPPTIDIELTEQLAAELATAGHTLTIEYRGADQLIHVEAGPISGWWPDIDTAAPVIRRALGLTASGAA